MENMRAQKVDEGTVLSPEAPDERNNRLAKTLQEIIPLSECARILEESARREENLLAMPEVKEALSKLSKVMGEKIENSINFSDGKLEGICQSKAEEVPLDLVAALVCIYREALKSSDELKMVRLEDNLLPSGVEVWQLANELGAKGLLDQQGSDELGELFLKALLQEIEDVIHRDADAEMEIYDNMLVGADEKGYYLRNN